MSWLQDFAISLTNPAVLTLWALAAAGVVVLSGRVRLGVTMLVLACCWTGLWSIPLASDTLRNLLERQNPPRDEAALPRVDAIVVLGGGVGYSWLAREHVDPEDLGSSRIAAGARAWLAGKAPIVILSGGGVGDDTEARMMATAIMHLGVPRTALLLEERSRSTRDNARNTAALAKARRIGSVLLVTSSLHMPRAAFEFQNTRLEVIPVPVPERAQRTHWTQRWLPSRSALRRSSRALKEIAALLVVRARQQAVGHG